MCYECGIGTEGCDTSFKSNGAEVVQTTRSASSTVGCAVYSFEVVLL